MIDLVTQLTGYRSFGPDRPLAMELNGDTVAITGGYRSGKAAALKWVHELRPALEVAVGLPVAGHGADFTWRSPVRGNEDIFHIGMSPPRMELVLRRSSAEAVVGRIEIRMTDDMVARVEVQERGGGFTEALTLLTGAHFYGAFRSALNIDADIGYFDLNGVGSFRRRVDVPAAEAAAAMVSDIFDVEVTCVVTENELAGLRVGVRDFRWPAFGSGLSQFFAMFYETLTRRPGLVCIEEPELHLAPERRKTFLAAMAKLCPAGLVFATHDEVLAAWAERRIET
jgi:hypothetical protein